MLGLLSWIGLIVFSVALEYDFWSEWLGPRLLSRSWFPGEPDLPPVDGEGENPTTANYRRVVLASYGAGAAILLIAMLDALLVKPTFLPYANIVKTYGGSLFSLLTILMWFSEGQTIVLPYHKRIRYIFGVLTVIMPLYIATCGSGIL